jgi:amino acid adenylation domain-containing protein
MKQTLESKRARLAGALRSKARSPKLRMTSFAQQRLWFLHRIDPTSPVYNIAVSLRLAGDVNLPALRRAFEEIVNRHEVLRTTFVEKDGAPLQRIMPASGFRLRLVDFGELDSQVREQAARERAYAEAIQPFDLVHGPVLRVTVVRLSAADHVLLVSLHHIAGDGWSLGALTRELGILYEAYDRGAPSPLPALPIQYSDFAVWQRNHLTPEVIQSEIAWWTERLANAPQLDLPTDRPRPAVPNHRGDAVPFSAPSEVAEGARSLMRESGMSLFMILLASFKVLLGRYCRQNDICVGAAIANRNRIETEDLIGFFVNQLVLRTRIDPSRRIAELFGQVRNTVLDAFSHQDLPYEKLVAELQPERDLQHFSLFRTALIVQNAPRPVEGLKEIKVKPFHQSHRNSHLDLALYAWETATGFGGSIDYDTDLFDRPTVERMRDHFLLVLEQLIANPGESIRNISVLTAAERRQLTGDWNVGAKYDLDAESAHALFERQVEASPDATALKWGNASISYGELNRRANQLAHFLRAAGVGPEVKVALCVDRGPLMPISILAVLKAGGAYVPIDIDYPAGRLAYMLNDSAPRVILTEERLLPMLPACDARPIALDSQWGEIASHSASNPEKNVDRRNLAYLIYTSGSTGQPKAVELTHEGVVNLAAAQRGQFELGPQSSALQFASLSFDAATWEWIMALLTGGSLVLAPRDQLLPGAGLERLISESQVTTALLTPSVLALMAPIDVDGLETLLVGGEACSVELAEHWGPGRKLYNAYGPTEITVCATMADLKTSETGTPIGRPLGNLTAYVLDEEMRPTPVGVAGELYLGGAGVARGYAGQPALTAERFAPNPFGQTGDRLYRTGDLACWRGDAQLDFVGRVDRQVKLRGHRIETGEIEAVLRNHPEVKRAAVVMREDAPGEKRLVGYVVPQRQRAEEPTAVDEEWESELKSELRRSLSERLPQYMMPGSLVVIEEIPLTPNGKIDLNALPAPETFSRLAKRRGERPRSWFEERVATIWGQVLRVEEIDLEDNFFELGGHSLLVTQALARLREAIDMEIPPRALFEAQTVKEFAARIQLLERDGNSAHAEAIVKADRNGRLPLSFGQERLWFLYALEPQSLAYTTPNAFRFTGEIDVASLKKAFNEVVRRHEILRTRFPDQDGKPWQQIDPPGDFPVPYVDLTEIPENARERVGLRVAAEHESRPFDLRNGPLIRVLLIRITAQNHPILLTMHHIITDGWSMGVLANDFAEAYEAYRAGKPSPLPPLQIQYGDFSVWQRALVSGETLERQLEYWRNQLAGFARLDLPADYPRPRVSDHLGRQERTRFSPEFMDSLRAFCHKEGVTLFMVSLAAWQLLLSRYACADDVTIGTDVANRNRIETEGLIGFFINQLALRVRIDPEESFSALLKQAREVTIGAYAHQDLPFERLVADLAPERGLDHAPLFQVKIVLHYAGGGYSELAQTEVAEYGDDVETVKLDMNLMLVEVNGILRAVLHYSTELFAPPTARRMLSQWKALVEAAVASPNIPVSELQILAEAERRQILEGHARGAAHDIPPVCAHVLIEQAAGRFPDAIAVCDGRRQISYRELDSRANQLAHFLRGLGIGPEMMVALYMERSASAVIALLGALKAGAAYLPLDESFPSERVGRILEDASVAVVLTESRLIASLPASWAQAICLDSDWPQIASQPVSKPDETATARNLAYVIYTSGSTGNPKGVAVERSQLLSYLSAISATIGFGRESYAMVSTFAADLGNTALFPSLCSGGSLHIVDADLARDASGLAEFFLTRQIDTVKITPSHLQGLMAIEPGAALMPRKNLVLGGEASRRQWVEEIRELRPDCQIWNHYGPTECAVGVLAWAVTGQGQAAYLPLGSPLPNMETYVVDGKLQLTPPGIPGELLIGGPSVARGYLNRPSLTAERFAPNPFSAKPGERLYRTGDKVRLRPDDTLEFMGRIDRQFKFYGHRIEPGEIESAILAQGGLEQAIVVLREEADRPPAIVAFVVPSLSSSFDPEQLRGALQKTLPAYMTPAHIISLAALPLTPNGKVDARALPLPQSDSAARPRRLKPRDNIETYLKHVWEDVLETPDTAIDENFFALGGTSMNAVALSARLINTFGDLISVRTIFERPTIEQLAALIRQEVASMPPGGVVPIQPKGRRRPLFCVHPSGGLVHCYVDLARLLGPEQPVLGLQAPDIEGSHRIASTIEEMAGWYVANLMATQSTGPYQITGLSMGGVVAYEMARQLEAAGEEVRFLALLDTYFGEPIDTPITEAEIEENQWEGLIINAERTLGIPAEEMRALSWDDRAKLFLERAHSAGRLPKDLTETQFRRLLYTSAIHSLLKTRYHVKPYRGSVILLNTEIDFLDEMRGLDGVALGEVHHHRLPGFHSDVLNEPSVGVVAEIFGRYLEK